MSEKYVRAHVFVFVQQIRNILLHWLSHTHTDIRTVINRGAKSLNLNSKPKSSEWRFRLICQLFDLGSTFWNFFSSFSIFSNWRRLIHISCGAQLFMSSTINSNPNEAIEVYRTMGSRCSVLCIVFFIFFSSLFIQNPWAYLQ